ncbi:MAG TPA: hypothetical protein VFM15_03045 [Gammaproteobacteria bacterium]|nr:hypothetical protein [Gammaproteobacteria bacterium]
MHASTEQLIALRDGDIVDAGAQTHVRACTQCAAELNSLVDLRARLGTLPEFALPENAWQAIATRLDRDDSGRGFWRSGLRATAAALVASVVVAVSWMTYPTASRHSDVATLAESAPQASVPQLMRQSNYLERAVLSLNANADHLVISAGTAATVAALEDRIALLDYEINRASAGQQGRERLSQLWQQRVNLLQSLAAVRYAQVASNSI